MEKLLLENAQLKSEIEKLKQSQNDDRNLQDEINDLRLTQNKAANLSKLSAQQMQVCKNVISNSIVTIPVFKTQNLNLKGKM